MWGVVIICRQLEIDEKLAKEQRRYEREERRKAKLLAKLKVKSSEDINEKILKEEKKLLKAQRKLEAIRLIEELFKRINVFLWFFIIVYIFNIIFLDKKGEK